MRKKYMLITVVEREISVNCFEAKEEAQSQTRSEMAESTWDEDVNEAFISEHPKFTDEADGEIAWWDTGAWVSDGVNHDNYDWLILDLESLTR